MYSFGTARCFRTNQYWTRGYGKYDSPYLQKDISTYALFEADVIDRAEQALHSGGVGKNW